MKNDIFDTLKAFQRPYIDLQKAIKVPTSSIPNVNMIAPFKAMENALKAFQKPYKDLLKAIKVPTSSIPADIVAPHQAMMEKFKGILKQVDDFANNLDTKLKDELPSLAKQGWFLDIEMPICDVANLASDIKEIEPMLVDYFEDSANGIEQKISTKFPLRKNFIRAAFNAHKRGEYELSIPVFLAQADGICKETVDFSLFAKNFSGKNKNLALKDYIESLKQDPSLRIVLYSLNDPETLPLFMSEGRRGKVPDFTGLNRHMVLHGESLNYNTKINSLKAISLINFVKCFLREPKSKTEESTLNN